jgi:hypothetical protein
LVLGITPQRVEKTLRLLRGLEDPKDAISVLIEEFLPLGDLKPEGRVFGGNARNKDLGVLGKSFESFVFPELRDIGGPKVAEAHVKDIVDVGRLERSQESQCRVKRRLSLMEKAFGDESVKTAVNAKL